MNRRNRWVFTGTPTDPAQTGNFFTIYITATNDYGSYTRKIKVLLFF
jgi:hypothetical protein